MDIAFQVITSSIDPNTQNYLLNGVWLNQGQVATSMILELGLSDVVIQRRYVNDWLKCEKPNSEHIRNEKWSSI